MADQWPSEWNEYCPTRERGPDIAYLKVPVGTGLNSTSVIGRYVNNNIIKIQIIKY